MKRLTLALAAVLVLLGALAAAGPAAAGGSTWEFDAARYQPGDRATARAAVGWDPDGGRYTPDVGPFGAWLWRFDPRVIHPYGTIPDDAVWVADVVISLDPYEQNGVLFGPHHVTVEFTVPDLPPGRYELLHCNDPCTSTLGDLTFGGFRIVAPPSPPTTSSPPTTVVAAAPLVASAGSGGPPSWLPLVLGSTVALGFGVALVWLLGDRRPRQATVKPT